MWRFGAFGLGPISFAENLKIDAALQEKVDLSFSLMHDKALRDYTKAIQLLNEVLVTERFHEAERALVQPKFAKDALYGKALYFYQESLKHRLERVQPFLIEACFDLSRIQFPSPSHLILHTRCLKNMKQFDLAYEKIIQASEILKKPDCPYTNPLTILKWEKQIKVLTRILKSKVTPKVQPPEEVMMIPEVSCAKRIEEEPISEDLRLLAADMVDMVLQDPPSAVTLQFDILKALPTVDSNAEPRSKRANQKRKHRGGRAKYKRL